MNLNGVAYVLFGKCPPKPIRIYHLENISANTKVALSLSPPYNHHFYVQYLDSTSSSLRSKLRLFFIRGIEWSHPYWKRFEHDQGHP